MTTRDKPWTDEPVDALRRATDRALAHAQAYEASRTLEEAKLASGMARRLGRLEESAGALAAASVAHYYQADLVDAVVAAIDAIRRSRDDADISRAWGAACLAFLAVEALDVARDCARRSLEHAEAAADACLLARAHFGLGFVANEAGAHGKAAAELRTAWRLLRGRDLPGLAVKAAGNLGRIFLDWGDDLAAASRLTPARRAWRHAARLFAMAARIPGTTGDAIIVKASLGTALERLGEAARGLPFLDEAVALLTPETLPWFTAETRLRRARARLAIGNLEGAAIDLEVAAASCRDDRAVAVRVECHLLHAELAARVRRTDKEAVFRTYARTAKLRREAEVEAARRQALALWARFSESGVRRG